MTKKRNETKKRKAQERAQAKSSARDSRLQWRRRQEQAANFALTKARKLRNVKDLIKARETGSDLSGAPASLGQVVNILTNTSDQALPNVTRLLLLLEKHHSDMLKGSRAPQGTQYVNGLRNITELQHLFVTKLEEWKPASKNRHKQFASLLRHLFAKYEVPLFMDEAWHRANAWGSSWNSIGPVKELQWWLDIANGKNIRKSEHLPWPMTKRMAHFFIQTPDDFTITGAFRWAQIHALGGDERIVRAVMATFLGQALEVGEQHTFYESVLRFFINNPMLDTMHYGPILDYLRNQKYVTQRGAPGPPQPNLSMKDRQPDALLNQVESWHARLGQEKRRRNASKWEHHELIGDWSYQEKKKDHTVIYSIVQLLTASELKEEGRRLEHCVGSYSWSCGSGRTSIWSVRRYHPDGHTYDPLGTVEISNEHNRIVQFAAKRNRAPDTKAKSLVEKWSREFGIEVSRWIRW